MKSRKISMVIALAAAASIAAITAFLSSGAAPSPSPETGQSAPVQTVQAPTVEQSGEYGLGNAPRNGGKPEGPRKRTTRSSPPEWNARQANTRETGSCPAASGR